MTRNLFSITAILLVVGIGIAQGMLSDRWGIPANVTAAAQMLQSIPLTVGKWQGRDGEPLSERAVKVSGAVGYISRSYSNDSSDVVSVMILCGRPGPISSHAPDVCFEGAGLVQTADAQPRAVPGEAGAKRTFNTAEFRPPATRPGPNVGTYWGCSVDGREWDAVSDGRFEYAGHPHLYRAIITSTSPMTVAEGETPVIEAFLAEFLPVVSQTLAAAPN